MNGVQKFRKKPVVIEAVQFDGENLDEVIAFTEGEARWEPMGELVIPTLEGDHRADFDDWIIKGVAGEFYPCKPEIFAATYEAARTNFPAEETKPAGERDWREEISDAICDALDNDVSFQAIHDHVETRLYEEANANPEDDE